MNTSERLASLGLRAIAVAAIARIVSGISSLFYLDAWSWRFADDAWIMLWTALAGVVLISDWPAWSAVVTLIGCSFASAPLEAAGGWKDWFSVYLLLPFVLWLIVLNVPRRMEAGPLRYLSIAACASSASLAVMCWLGFAPPWHALLVASRHWEWITPMSALALAVFAWRAVRAGYNLSTFGVSIVVSVLPAIAILVIHLVTNASWTDSEWVVVPVNLWLSTGPAVAIAIERHMKRSTP